MDDPRQDEERWLAVQRRDTDADGRFVYAVRTTGVYCRPSCPSRPAKRDNLLFFASGEEARQAGFRACKRCRPDDVDAIAHRQAVSLACERIRQVEEMPDLTTLATEAGLSPWHFQRVFKAQVGLSPKQFAMAERRRRLREALTTAETVTDAIYAAGYSTSSRAYADARVLGLEPQMVLGGGKGETIRHASAHSSLGEILVAATERGLCMVEFGDPEQLLVELRRRFPKAVLEPADARMQELIGQVVDHIDRPGASGAMLPLDFRGTVFQERVWRALMAIPAGETVSYAELAARIGQPMAFRAVARACATNVLAVVVPCHRVVRGNGDLSGYKWGINRKQALLDKERG